MKIYIKLLFIALCFFLPHGLKARDINLDEIYIKKTSPDFKKLALEKLETYKEVGAVFINRDIIFAGWISGDEILYVKESDSLKTNFIYKFRLRDRRSLELCRLQGVITVVRVSPNGRYVIIKRLIQSDRIIPNGEMVIVETKTGKMSIRSSSYGFLDFSISNYGNSIIFENPKGIVELSLDTGYLAELLKKKDYSDIIISSNSSVAFLSPDRQRILVVNGSGGNYKAKIFEDDKFFTIKGISSLSEIFWLDNYTVIYRMGYAGNYSVALYNIKNNKTITLLQKSFNTNICYSVHPGIISFLKEQVIFLYNRSENQIFNTGIEGEDISFAPNGNMFISLLYKRLFLVNLYTLKKKRIELGRSWKSILIIYNSLKNKKSEFENEYSQLYLDRKIQLYSGLVGL